MIIKIEFVWLKKPPDYEKSDGFFYFENILKSVSFPDSICYLISMLKVIFRLS